MIKVDCQDPWWQKSNEGESNKPQKLQFLPRTVFEANIIDVPASRSAMFLRKTLPTCRLLDQLRRLRVSGRFLCVAHLSCLHHHKRR